MDLDFFQKFGLEKLQAGNNLLAQVMHRLLAMVAKARIAVKLTILTRAFVGTSILVVEDTSRPENCGTITQQPATDTRYGSDDGYAHLTTGALLREEASIAIIAHFAPSRNEQYQETPAASQQH